MGIRKLPKATPSLIMLLLLVGGCSCFILSGLPPKEKKLIQNFQSHRAQYEQLRDMLEADKQLVRLGSWGVETTSNVVPVMPPQGGFSVDRYKQYMGLLKEIGGFVVTREQGEHANPSIGVWGSGFAGHTHHVGICWADETPVHRVPTLDGYRGRIKDGEPEVGYRQIDSNWYLWSDL